MFADNCKQTGMSGEALLSMTDNDLEQVGAAVCGCSLNWNKPVLLLKVLFMKLPMHRKKLKLALQVGWLVGVYRGPEYT